MLHEQIKNKIKEAMLAKNTVLLETLRSMVASFTNELVAKNRKPNETLSDEEAIAVIARLAKQRKDSIEQFKKGGRQDLVDKEEAELKILQFFLPPQLSADDVKSIVREVINNLKASGMKDMGRVMKEVMPRVAGKADGKLVNEVVKEVLGG